MQPLDNVQPSFPSGKIFINPNFANPPKTHINPNFLQLHPSSIYVNPAFLNKPKVQPPPKPEPAEIITKTRTKLIRKTTVPAPQVFPSVECKPKVTSPKLVKIGSKKLVRASSLKTEFISRYALKRKTVSSDKLKVTKSVHKKLQFLNINGIMYKSTATKLQRKDSPVKAPLKERVIKVRGDRFVLEKNGKSLTRVNAATTDDKKLPRRIDIGGLTYVAKSKNVFVRTDIHKTRSHLSSARNKSISVLSKNRVKTNIPCPIYRRLGKCAANEKGRCPRKHDPNQIVVCSKFLRGDCPAKNCLLSHNVSLSKMPVCKFFLQGLCVRDDCPYLHKKLNEKAEVCMEFQRGFCHLADKCDKKHENATIAPRTSKTNTKKNIEPKTVKPIVVVSGDQPKESCRYFVDDEIKDKDKELEEKEVEPIDEANTTAESECTDVEEVDSRLFRRPKLGELPAFIPL